MKHVIRQCKTELTTGTTIRLLRSREETESKKYPDPNDPLHWKIGPAHNELVASTWDDKKKRFRDFIRMVVAPCEIPESMEAFLRLSKCEIERLLPRFANVDKLGPRGCVTVQTFSDFAEMLQRK